MIESITFNTSENKLIVTLDDATKIEYTDAATYLADHPDRVADCEAMGWQTITLA
jgi:hypothetical protein